ncbi:A/G-specific DNA-adenine glycosylase [Pedobacter westerhofensis]|uniref:Adenine DNA glycosylase n=1 Tax=Pedobacter westerhofensis TaxID=425512 RepID=A0A521EJD3_9SPHI|nr:A/G-specific adenine glycosylase [Pedobacter westerhofensis]SMO83982.1 A/G-specific DNA-adenine glycosylase [Pedobacter westerhofensis]
MAFQQEIINWYLSNKRSLPWRDTQDAYIIWLSEIILQQTRVEQGMPYFNRFLEAYPTVLDFAAATETEILKLWQGLGYYSRGRNMLFTARQIMELHDGVFPVRYSDLIRLKGIGEYTAAAISSFSSGEAKAVLDGNVFRVLSRYFGIDTPINSTGGKKQFSELAQSLIHLEDPALYNQAIMEFGALQCKPKSPDCPSCPLQVSCYAKNNNLISVLPVKLRKLTVKTRHINYFICRDGDNILVNKRIYQDIWQHLFDFPNIETTEAASVNDEQFINKVKQNFGKNVTILPLMEVKHLLTHQIIYVQFFALNNYIINFNINAEAKWVSWADFDQLPQPTILTKFINNYFNE